MPQILKPNLPEDKQPLPFEPETLPQARARYEDALEKIYNIGRIHAGTEDPPNLDRKNVFDFKSGLRLIISVEFAPLNKTGERGPYEHITGILDGINPSSINQTRTPIEELMRIYYYISKWNENKKKPAFQNITKQGHYHILFERPELLKRAKKEILNDFPDELKE